MPDIVEEVKLNRLKWAGLVVRMKMIGQSKECRGRRRRGRPSKRLMDNLRQLGDELKTGESGGR